MSPICHSWISVSVLRAFLLLAGLTLEFTKCVLAKLHWRWCCCPWSIIATPPDTAEQPGSEVGALWKGIQPHHLLFLSNYSRKGIFCLSLLNGGGFLFLVILFDTSHVIPHALLVLWFSVTLQFMHIKNRIQGQQDTVPATPHLSGQCCYCFCGFPGCPICLHHLLSPSIVIPAD